MSRRAIMAVLQRERAARLTSYDIHVRLDEEIDVSLAHVCASLCAMTKAKKVVRSKTKVRRRHRSPGAYIYSLPGQEPEQPEQQ